MKEFLFAIALALSGLSVVQSTPATAVVGQQCMYNVECSAGVFEWCYIPKGQIQGICVLK